jgi:hypothetical protein
MSPYIGCNSVGADDISAGGENFVAQRTIRIIGIQPMPRTLMQRPARPRIIHHMPTLALDCAERAVGAADSQHPVPSSHDRASASASSNSRSLPEVGEFVHTQFMTAMLTLTASQQASAPTQVLAQLVSHHRPQPYTS